jgi:succinate dehydrogenase/fumarate reductase cytochrome b subunit
MMELQPFVRPLVVVLLIAIVVSLGSALRHLARGTGEEDSRKMARALTIRISLSLALLALLIIAWYLGLISPHGLQPAPRQLR